MEFKTVEQRVSNLEGRVCSLEQGRKKCTHEIQINLSGGCFNCHRSALIQYRGLRLCIDCCNVLKNIEQN